MPVTAAKVRQRESEVYERRWGGIATLLRAVKAMHARARLCMLILISVWRSSDPSYCKLYTQYMESM